jgi:hypothetical protein
MISINQSHIYTGRGLSSIGRTEEEWKAAQIEAARKELIRADAERQRQMADWCAVAWGNSKHA